MPRRFLDSEPEPQVEEDLRSRGDGRRAERELELTLARLASDLIALREGQLVRLDLPEPVLDAVRDAHTIKTPAAQNRQLRVVRSALRNEDWSLVRGRLDALVRHGTIPAELQSADTPAARAHEWVARMIGEG